MIPDATVEAAARYVWEKCNAPILWGHATNRARAVFLQDARWALEAVVPDIEAPFIEALKYERAKVELLLSAQSRPAALPALAAAWDWGMQAMYDTTSSEWPPIPEQNPYRSES